MKQRIKVSSNSITDLYRLPCVGVIHKPLFLLCKKEENGEFGQCGSFFAEEGDWLIQHDDGTWDVEKGGTE